jgi:hypothetical protein
MKLAKEWINSHLVSGTLINPINPKGGLKVRTFDQSMLFFGANTATPNTSTSFAALVVSDRSSIVVSPWRSE